MDEAILDQYARQIEKSGQNKPNQEFLSKSNPQDPVYLKYHFKSIYYADIFLKI